MVLLSKIANLTFKLTRVLRENPRAFLPRAKAKLRKIFFKRVNTGWLTSGKVRAGGVFYPAAELSPGSAAYRQLSGVLSHPVTVIVPVYRGVDVTRRCLDSLMGSDLPDKTRILILNDCSPDVSMPSLLATYEADPRVTLIHQQENLGFVGNVNFGMRWCQEDDVVLLNSDTVVAGTWLQSLAAHAQQARGPNHVATVTATSNNATICSFPVMAGRDGWPAGLSTGLVQSVLGRHCAGRSVELPTGVGFCMFISRAALSAIGFFDEEAFGKGYGEENDFCMRALKSGWKNLQALDCAVFHQGEVSFGSGSHPGKERATRIINERYPDYESLVGIHAAQDPARLVRMGAGLALMAASGKAVHLILTHIHGGGVERAVREFVGRLGDQVEFLVLSRAPEKGFYRIRSADPSWGIDIHFNSRYSGDAFGDILRLGGVTHLHIHHLMDFDFAMLDLIRKSNVSFDFYVHDYWTICPQITLTDLRGRYCGEPDREACNTCISQRHLRSHAPIASGLPRDIVAWRNLYRHFLVAARQVIAPSQDVKARMQKYLAGVAIEVVYHEDQAPLVARKPVSPKLIPPAPLKVAVLGAIGVHKGLHMISQVQGVILSRKLSIEIVVIGEIDPYTTTAHAVRCTGVYKDSDLAGILARENVHLIWFPAGAPETYSYTLSHAVRAGLPVLAPEIGAFPERLNGRAATELLPVDADAGTIAEVMNQFRVRFST
jgi:GT2 family glycosyltransferase